MKQNLIAYLYLSAFRIGNENEETICLISHTIAYTCI